MFASVSRDQVDYSSGGCGEKKGNVLRRVYFPRSSRRRKRRERRGRGIDGGSRETMIAGRIPVYSGSDNEGPTVSTSDEARFSIRMDTFGCLDGRARCR